MDEKPTVNAAAVRGLTSRDYSEKLLADGFRVLSRLCAKVADLLETQRLQRQGFDKPGKWLERLDEGNQSDPRR